MVSVGLPPFPKKFQIRGPELFWMNDGAFYFSFPILSKSTLEISSPTYCLASDAWTRELFTEPELY